MAFDRPLFASLMPQRLIDKLDGDLEYALRQDGKMAPEEVENYAEVSSWVRKVHMNGVQRSGR
jgi:hypothetical protein